jgi:hypothetical protein
MSTKSNFTRMHELELMYWDTVIHVLGAWQNIHQPPGEVKSPNNPQTELSWAEYIVLAAAGLGLGIIIGAISRL